MRTGILIVILLAALSGAARADLLTVSGFGHGFINTPVAWNSASNQWRISATSAFGGGDLADSFSLNSLYSRDRWEFGAGFTDAGDAGDTGTIGGQVRYTLVHTPRDFYGTVLAGTQRTESNAADNSTGIFAALLGQKFRNGGISFTVAFWTDAGGGKGKGQGDTEFAGNLYFNLNKTGQWKGFGEGYGFSDSEAAAQAAGLIYEARRNVTLSAAYLHVSDPFDESRFQLGVHFMAR